MNQFHLGESENHKFDIVFISKERMKLIFCQRRRILNWEKLFYYIGIRWLIDSQSISIVGSCLKILNGRLSYKHIEISFLETVVPRQILMISSLNFFLWSKITRKWEYHPILINLSSTTKQFRWSRAISTSLHLKMIENRQEGAVV
jgi:hypothetical protein